MSINFKEIENTIDYRFNNRDLLQQAFVRRSYSEENGGQNNEVLEFIGDKALDFAVIRIMMERFGEITESKPCYEFKLRNPKYFNTKLNEGKFTDIKKDLVQKKALARSMEELGFQNQLFMGNGDILQNVQEQDSVKEDLFEAIIGAVALDSKWDMDKITKVVETMIDFDAYFENELDDDVDNYVGLVQEWSQRENGELPSYEYYNAFYGYGCILRLKNLGMFQGNGTSKAKARMNAAEKAYDFLYENDYIGDENEFESAVGEPDKYESLQQVNELYQKGLISKPEYTFYKDYDEYGDTLWTCDLEIDESDSIYSNTASSKNDAKRLSAYELLCDLIGY